MEKHSSGSRGGGGGSSSSSSNSCSTLISTLLPYIIKGSIPKKLFTSSIFLLRFLDTPQLPPRMVLTVEASKAGVTQFFDPFTRTLITNLPQNFNLTQFNSTHLTTEYHVVSTLSSYDPFPPDSLYLKALIVDGVSSKCTLLTLFKGGQVYKAYPFDGSDYHPFEKAFHIPTIVEDLIIYNGKVYALSNQEKLYLYSESKQEWSSFYPFFFVGDCRFYFDKVVVDTPAVDHTKRLRRRRLVVLTSSKGDDANKLYMIVPIDDGYVRGPTNAIKLQFEVKELKKTGKSKWVWEKVTCFGDNDQVLFVSRDHCFFVAVDKFPGCHLSNCIVYSDDAFPQYSECEGGWNYGTKGGNEVAVFPLEGLGDPYFPIDLWSTPTWLSLNTSSSLQPQSQSRRQSEPPLTQSDFNVEQKKPSKSASEEQSIGIFSSNESQPTVFTRYRPVKFQGIDVESEHLPLLEKVRTKYGDVIEGSAIRGCDAKAMAWTCLAKMLLILQSNSGNTLTDEQASYLSTTLSDLKFMQLKVDWLVPFVEKALAMHKMQASLMEVEKAKARAEEMEQEFLSKMAEMRLEQSGPVHLGDRLGEGLL